MNTLPFTAQSEANHAMRRYADVFSRIPADRLSHLIDSYIRRDDYKDITRDRLLRCLTYEQIAENYGYSVRQIKSIISNTESLLVDIINIK
jgi:hypothetical protein